VVSMRWRPKLLLSKRRGAASSSPTGRNTLPADRTGEGWGLAHRSKNPTLVPPSTRKGFADGGVSRSVAKRQIVACREPAPRHAKVGDVAKQDSAASICSNELMTSVKDQIRGDQYDKKLRWVCLRIQDWPTRSFAISKPRVSPRMTSVF